MDNFWPARDRVYSLAGRSKPKPKPPLPEQEGFLDKATRIKIVLRRNVEEPNAYDVLGLIPEESEPGKVKKLSLMLHPHKYPREEQIVEEARGSCACEIFTRISAAWERIQVND